jgi:opacity protein-like surface antigen
MKKFFSNQPQPRTRFALAAGLVALAASTAATAQETRWYVAADVGQSKYKTESRDVGILGGSFDRKDTQTGFAIGAQLDKGIAVEFGYADFGKAKVSGTGAIPCAPATVCLPALFNVSGDAQAKSTHLSLVSSTPLMDKLSLFGRIGASRTDRTASVRVNNTTVSTNEKKSEAIYGVGLRYAFAPNVEGTLEWKRLDNTKVEAASVGLMLRF